MLASHRQPAPRPLASSPLGSTLGRPLGSTLGSTLGRPGVILGLCAALLVAPVTPAQALANTSRAAPTRTPDAPAGDENIPDDAPEPGQLAPLDKSKASRSAPAQPQRSSLAIQRKGTNEQGYDLSVEADAAFDAENYGEAARLYTRALGLLSENETNHVARSVILANCVTAYEQVYAQTREVEHLRTAQRLVQEYLRACKGKHGVGCDRFPETQEARSRVQSLMAAIDTAAPRRLRVPPEVGSAPGGKPFSNAVDVPDAPNWIAPAIAGGIVLAGGGTALIYYAATDDKYGPIYQRDLEFRDTADTTTDTSTDGSTDTTDTDGSSSTSTVTTVSFSAETKGKLLIGVGAFIAAAGIGFAVLGAMGLAKHRRINRERRSTLAVSPTFGRGAAGLAVSGKF